MKTPLPNSWRPTPTAEGQQREAASAVSPRSPCRKCPTGDLGQRSEHKLTGSGGISNRKTTKIVYRSQQWKEWDRIGDKVNKCRVCFLGKPGLENSDSLSVPLGDVSSKSGHSRCARLPRALRRRALAETSKRALSEDARLDVDPQAVPAQGRGDPADRRRPAPGAGSTEARLPGSGARGPKAPGRTLLAGRPGRAHQPHLRPGGCRGRSLGRGVKRRGIGLGGVGGRGPDWGRGGPAARRSGVGGRGVRGTGPPRNTQTSPARREAAAAHTKAAGPGRKMAGLHSPVTPPPRSASRAVRCRPWVPSQGAPGPMRTCRTPSLPGPDAAPRPGSLTPHASGAGSPGPASSPRRKSRPASSTRRRRRKSRLWLSRHGRKSSPPQKVPRVT